MQAVCEILMKTTGGKMNGTFGLFGFGAKVRMPNLNTERFDHHCFPLNGNVSNPFVGGLRNMLATYRNCIKDIEFGSKVCRYVRADAFCTVLDCRNGKGSQIFARGSKQVFDYASAY